MSGSPASPGAWPVHPGWASRRPRDESRGHPGDRRPAGPCRRTRGPPGRVATPPPRTGSARRCRHVADLVSRIDTMRHDQAKQHQEELMYAIVRQHTYDPATIARAEQAQAAAQGLHAAQPGYAGGLVIDDGQHFIAVTSGKQNTDA